MNGLSIPEMAKPALQEHDLNTPQGIAAMQAEVQTSRTVHMSPEGAMFFASLSRLTAQRQPQLVAAAEVTQH